MISVLILTKNEELDLPGCLDSVAWSDDVQVFDSFSTDHTVEIAAARGAKVTQRAFDNYAAQRNAALHGLPFRHPWVLILDADERIPAALRDEMFVFVRRADPAIAAGRIRRRDFLWDRWLKYAQMSPFYIRLVRPEQAHYAREVNEVLRVEGRVLDLAEPFDHFPFSKGITHWFDKHNRYSSLEARLLLQARIPGAGWPLWKALFTRDFNERRVYQKQLFYQMPLRPVIKCLYLAVVRRGFLDGRAGITYAVLQGIYEYMIDLKAHELQEADRYGQKADAAVREHQLPASDAVRR